MHWFEGAKCVKMSGKNNLKGCTCKVQKDDLYIVYAETLKIGMNHLNKEKQEKLLKKITEMSIK